MNIHLGLIAQEVQKVIPEVVTQITDKEEDGMGYLGIAYSELIPVLIGAIQDQQNIIEDQQSQIEKHQTETLLMKEQLSEVMSVVAALSTYSENEIDTTSED